MAWDFKQNTLIKRAMQEKTNKKTETNILAYMCDCFFAIFKIGLKLNAGAYKLLFHSSLKLLCFVESFQDTYCTVQ